MLTRSKARKKILSSENLSPGQPASKATLSDLEDATVYGASKLAKGTVLWGEWSAEILDVFGEAMRPHLVALYAASEEHLEVANSAANAGKDIGAARQAHLASLDFARIISENKRGVLYYSRKTILVREWRNGLSYGVGTAVTLSCLIIIVFIVVACYYEMCFLWKHNHPAFWLVCIALTVVTIRLWPAILNIGENPPTYGGNKSQI